MPYSGASDPSLPANVKKLPAKKRRMWISIFNRTMASCEGEDCEGKAFRIANGVLKKRKDMEPIAIRCECGEAHEVEYGTKEYACSNCHRGMALTWNDPPPLTEEDKCGPDIAYYRPYGGATSFEEIDSWHEAWEMNHNIQETKSNFDAIYENIQNNPEMAPEQKIAAVETATKEMIQRMQNPPEMGMKDKIKSWLFGKAKLPNTEKQRNSLFLVTKDTSGRWRWLAIFTNKFEDKEQEIFSEDSHKEYEAWVDQTKQYPDLYPWHIPLPLGKADCVTYADGFMVASGVFHKEYEDVAERLSSMKELGVSHGFSYPETELIDGVYHKYRTFEISMLPVERAANPWTAFNIDQVKQEVAMGFNTQKREFLVKALGENRVSSLEIQLPELTKELEEAGVGWKDLAEAMGSANGGNGNGDNGDPADAGGDTTTETPTTEDPPAGGEPVPAEGNEEPVTLEGVKAALQEILKPVDETIIKLQADIKELQRTDDEKIAARMQPKTAIADQKHRPSQSDDNLVDGKSLEQPDGPEDNNAARAIVEELLLGKRRIPTG